MEQILKLVASEKFDYILIEASGICEPMPIVQTIHALSDQAANYGVQQVCRLDNVVTVVDAYGFTHFDRSTTVKAYTEALLADEFLPGEKFYRGKLVLR